jgi:tryptophan synthase alpha subunit
MEHTGMSDFTSPGGRFRASATTLKFLLEWAYGIQPSQHSGGPSWIGTDRYDIAAKAAGPVTVGQLRLMLQTLLAYGRAKLLADLRRAGLAGLIVPDLPLEEAGEWLTEARAHDQSLVFLVAPTSDDERIRRIAQESDAFIYAVSVAGTTGVRDEANPQLKSYLARIRRVTDKPVAVGFGISTPDHIRALRGQADGAVIGSRLVQAIERGEDGTALIKSLKQATRS